jgi:hypothetical protein
VIEYVAGSRGFYQKINRKKRWLGFLQNWKRQDCPYENFKFDWKELVSFFKMIELDSLAKLKAPTEKRVL